MGKTYKVKATALVDLEWEVDAENENDALSKFYASDIKDVIDEARILDVNSENEEVDIEEATFIIKTTKISYCIEEEDVCEDICLDPEIEEDSEEFYEAINAKIEEVKNSLPQEITLEVYCNKEDLDDYVVDAISEKTGWLINYCDYEIVGVK